jgi:hypothetical protein
MKLGERTPPVVAAFLGGVGFVSRDRVSCGPRFTRAIPLRQQDEKHVKGEQRARPHADAYDRDITDDDAGRGDREEEDDQNSVEEHTRMGDIGRKGFTPCQNP